MGESCKDRLPFHLASRLADFQEIFDDIASTDDEVIDEAHDRIVEYPLELSTMTVVKILISTGGPADWFECFIKEQEIVRITYHFQDWFDYHYLELNGEAFDIASAFCEYFIAGIKEVA